MKGTSWLLGGGYPWPTARGVPPAGVPASVVSDPELGLSLAALANGPLGLESPGGSLGRLTLPLGVAVAHGRLFLLSSDGALVYAWDAERQELRAMREIGAERLATDVPPATYLEPRRFRGAANIAARGRLLYVADPNAHRVQVFDWPTGALVRIHAGFAGPTDVAAGRRGVYVLDAQRGSVLLASTRSSSLELVAEVRQRRRQWTRLAVDRAERLYLRGSEPSLVDGQPDHVVLDVVKPISGRVARSVSERVSAAGTVRSRFAEPLAWSSRSAAGEPCTFAVTETIADPCNLRAPLGTHQRSIRVGDWRWVLDRTRRIVEVRDLHGRRVHRFGPLDPMGERTVGRATNAWQPADVAQHDRCTLLLDDHNQVVYAHEPGSPTLRRWFARPRSADQPRTGLDDWHRIAVDDGGVLLLWDGGGQTVDRVDLRGRALGTCAFRDAERFFNQPSDDAPLPCAATDLRFGRDGQLSFVRDKGMPDMQRIYEREGTWISEWRDSDLYQCQWHLVELAISELPPGSRIAVRTRTSNEQPTVGGEQATTLSGSWSEPLIIVAPAQPTDKELETAKKRDLLVQSGPGRYLQLLVELSGDGLATPVISRLRLKFPYESLRQFLPALYSSPDEQRQFLDRLLGVVQRTWDDIEHTATGFERYLDPDTVPTGPPMRWLASWLGVRLEGTWTDVQNRRLFRAARDALAHWGTPAALRGWITAYLVNLSGHDAHDLERVDLPGIVEGFVERRRFMLGRDDTTRLGAAEPIWGPAVERRLQIGVFDREGEVELVSVGDPALDVFQHSAHRFRVYVPSAWIRTAADESILRRAIDAQTPAHVSWELVLIEPRFRVGVQSTVGLDSVIAAPVVGALACPTDEEPTSRPPHERLGFDLVLGAGHDDGALGGPALILA